MVDVQGTLQLAAWIALGGAIGALGRAGLSLTLNDGPLPYGTLLANVLGCLILGVLLSPSMSWGTVPSHVQLALTVGMVGAFTTMSAFSFETMDLLRDGKMVEGFGYAALMLVLCFGAVLIGLQLADWSFGPAIDHQ